MCVKVTFLKDWHGARKDWTCDVEKKLAKKLEKLNIVEIVEIKKATYLDKMMRDIYTK